jgi:two-component system, chemotaxis family, chemotaxis protein CheY
MDMRDILIVDDSRAMRNFLRRALSMTSLEIGTVHEAENGLEALNLLDEHTVEVIFSDINMPVMDGAVFVGELAKSEVKRKIPVIVVSTDSSAERKSQMYSLGAKGYIAKPFSPEQLEHEVVRLLWEASDEVA